MLVRFALFLILVNVVTLAAFALDKQRARSGRYRIAERTLLTLALIGGTPGAVWASRVLRHKTGKTSFRTRLVLIAALQIALALALMAPSIRDAIGEALLTLR